MLTSKQRAILRGKANTMDPVFQIGKGEIDQPLIGRGEKLPRRPGADQAEGAGDQHVQRPGGRRSCWPRPPGRTACR